MTKILVIEDEKDMAEMVKADLFSSGYNEVTVAYDGEDGLNQARTIHPDLIISDINLPKMDGYKICEALKAEDEFRGIPIILLTVRDSKAEKKIGYAMGADAYLTKPYKREEFISLVKQFIK